MSATTTIVDQLRAMFERFGTEHYGEDASQLAHALQSAHLARLDGCADSLIVAALLHDVGQFLDDAGNAAERLNHDARHELLGAAFLRHWFPESVTEPVRLHVDAKRYLCATEPDYADGLSEASRLSLRLQGGTMSAEEAQRFRGLPFAEEAIRLRRYDDAAKRPNWVVPDLETYFPLLETLATPAA